MSAQTKEARPGRPDFERGERVAFADALGVRPTEGTVLSVKPGASEWYVEVREDDATTWAVPSCRVERVRLFPEIAIVDGGLT